MTIDDAFARIKNSQPAFVHISGKTSTGKSTFANKLKQELGYEVMELDKIVNKAVIQALGLADRGHVFYEVYKMRDQLDWINRFVTKAHKVLETHKENSAHVVIDGAIANSTTLQELLEPFPETEILYLHPNSLETYKRYLTSRFVRANAENHAGLPLGFWELVKPSDFAQFCQDRILTPAIKHAIHDYALNSQESSKKRLHDLQGTFNEILVVEI